MLVPRPRERLLELVAFRYFVENKSQIKIGKDEEIRRLYHLGTLDPQLKLPPAVSQTTINRLAHEARELGVAGVSVDWSFAVNLKEDKGLSAELADSFGLDECLVLFEDGGSDERDRNEESGALSEPEDEQRLILGMANVTAREVRPAWSAGDHIICGGGQTVCWFARAVRRNAPRKRNLTFSPLSGRLWVEDWLTDIEADIMERPLDADDAVYILSEAFEEKGGRFSQINQPLYMEDQTTADKTLAKHSPLGPDGGWNWELPEATWAYVGVGSLESMNHRLAKFLERFEKGVKAAKQSYLRVAGPTLIEIRDTCKDCGLPLPGDVANRLFPTFPLPWEIGGAASHDELREGLARVNYLVNELNGRAVVMTWEHLRRTRAVRVIAGGESKRRALWTVLLAASVDSQASRSMTRGTQSAPIVNQLTTDRETAKALLRALRFLKGKPELERLYHELCNSIGLSRSASRLEAP